ncbi:MAG: glutathione S-transferase family protein [Rhizobiaceae bacterium]
MLTLQTFKPSLGTQCPSPFGMKADALLTMSGLPYQKEFGNLLKAPRKKFPVLKTDRDLVPDSAHIQSFLEQQYGVDFDDHLSTEELAIANGFRRLIEDHLYFLNLHFRWKEHGGAIKQAFFGDAPAPLRGLIFRKVQKTIFNTLHLQGLGRHTRNELIGFIDEDVKALADHMGDKPYFMGSLPSSIDASLYGTLHNMLDSDLETPGKRAVQKHQNLVDYCDRFRHNVLHA